MRIAMSYQLGSVASLEMFVVTEYQYSVAIA